MNMHVTPTRPSITQWTAVKLDRFERETSEYTNTVVGLCSPQSRIYQASQFRVLAQRFRAAADVLDERADLMEGRHAHG